jgi:hypothetical protein
MNVQLPYQRPVSLWSRALAGLLMALLAWVTVELAWSVVRGWILPWPLVKTLLFLAIAGPALVLCGFIVLTGHPPQWWSRLEALGAASNAPGSPFWKKSWPRRPRWLQRAGLAVLACGSIGYAIITTVGMSDISYTPKALVTLAIVWCLALGVVGAIILWWRAVPQLPTQTTVDDVKHERGSVP